MAPRAPHYRESEMLKIESKARKGATWLRLAVTSSVIGLAVAGTPALAQDAATQAADEEGITDIVVTAQRREQNSQKTALSIEVFSGEDLRAAGVGKSDDLTKLAPGIQAAGGTTAQIYIRGVGDFGVTATANPAVVTNLDGVTVARPQAIAGNFFDLERIEVLKGPQGTLYGRNASGGAVNLITAAPKLGQTGGFIEGNFGNYDQIGAEGALNLAMGDSAAARLSFQVNDRDGYLSDGTDDDEHHSVRLQVKADLGERATVRAGVSYTHLGGKGTGLAVIPRLAGQSAWTGNTDPVAGAAYIGLATAIFNGALAGGCDPSPPPVGNCPPAPAVLQDPSAFAAGYFQDVDSYAANLQADINLDFATLTLIPGYRKTKARFTVVPSFLYNVGGAYTGSGDRSDGEESDQYSFEARLGGESDKFKWVIGGYWFKEDQSASYALQGGLLLNTVVSTQFKTEALAAFGQATYSLSDMFRLTGGIRYTNDKRSALDLQKFAVSPAVTTPNPALTGGLAPIPCLPNVPTPGSRLPGTLCPLINQTPGFYDSRVSFNKVTWKAGIEVDLAEQSMLFADVSRGFKAGGFNVAVSLTDPTKLQSFAPEVITAYTLGIKNRFLDNRLQFNVEAFYWDYKDLQLSAQAFDGTGNIVLLTQNAGKAKVQGIETNLVFKAWQGGTLRGAVSYVDSEYKSFIIQQSALFVPPGRVACPVSAPNAQGLVTIDCSGRPLIRSPKWSGNIGLTQVFELGNSGNVAFDADMAFASKRFVTADFTAAQLAGSYQNISAALTYNAPEDRWFVSAWIRNLTNEKIYSGGGGHQAAFVSGWNTSNIAPPRTYGVRAGVKF
jgi:iron complex outermembrane recepter protein